jgi:hypothetical protein
MVPETKKPSTEPGDLDVVRFNLIVAPSPRPGKDIDGTQRTVIFAIGSCRYRDSD